MFFKDIEMSVEALMEETKPVNLEKTEFEYQQKRYISNFWLFGPLKVPAVQKPRNCIIELSLIQQFSIGLLLKEIQRVVIEKNESQRPLKTSVLDGFRISEILFSK